MASKHREQHIIDSVPCPTCGAKIRERCRGLLRPDKTRGNPPMRSDPARRALWQESKPKRELSSERASKMAGARETFGGPAPVILTCGCGARLNAREWREHPKVCPNRTGSKL